MAQLFRRLPDASPRGAQCLAMIDAARVTDSCVVLGTAHNSEFPPARRPLTLAAAAFGRVRYEFDSRSVAVDDDTFLILNDGRVHQCLIQSDEPVESLQFYFHRTMLDDVLYASSQPPAVLLNGGNDSRRSGFEFFETLTRRENLVSPVFHYIRHCILTQPVSGEWLEEQLFYLLQRMVTMQMRANQREQQLRGARPSTRVELRRRLALAADYIDSNFEQDFGLRELSRIACLSRFHLLRLFRGTYGVSPRAYKMQKRLLVANRLLNSGKMSKDEAAVQVGYATRASLGNVAQRMEATLSLR